MPIIWFVYIKVVFSIVYIPTAEEIEEMFEEHLEEVKWEREQEVNIKEKTA